MSLRAELIRLGLRWFLKPRSGHGTIEQWRRICTASGAFIPPPPAGTKISTHAIGSAKGHLVTTPVSIHNRNILYLHGGGYSSGAWACCRHLAWHIAWAARASVLA